MTRAREKPRRNEGRVQHDRIRPKSSANPTPEELAYWASLHACCVVCGATETVVHHILANAPDKRSRRDHRLIVKLCPSHHNMGDVSVHMLGSEAKFRERTGVDLVSIAVANRDRYFGENK